MYKLELKIDGKFVNNFYNGSIYDLVFLDLEFWPDYDYTEGKAVQRIYGYTLTRLIKSNKKQYIKIKFLEFKTEEEQLIKDIIQDIDALNDKVLIGFNIKDSDLVTLRNRLKVMSIYTDIKAVNIFDFRKYSKSHEYRGLNGLFEYLKIKVNKKIDGSYFYKNTKKIFSRKSPWKDILLNMFEYCLEDAAGYFQIVSSWNQRFPKITKDMVTRELLNYSAIEKEASFQAIVQDAEIFPMENFQASSDQLISNLTVADLEALIVKIVQKTLKEEMQKLKHEPLADQTTQINHPLKVFI